MADETSPLTPPYYPVVYVRGFAFSQNEVNTTTEDPYMGFNLGATKVRRESYAPTERFVFEGPIVRLMKDYGYRDIYADGNEQFDQLPSRSIVIYRYYESLDSELGSPPTRQLLVGDWGGAELMQERARRLGELIHQVRDGVCGDRDDLRRRFRVHLVAHSMGGLICRCLLQKYPAAIANNDGDSMVAKLFTYATPHNGIEVFGWNAIVPPYFRRSEMRKYLDFTDGDDSDAVDTLNGKFPPRNVFCLVGTNYMDYDAGGGWSRRAAGEASDGLVKIANATLEDAREAYTHRSHSGPHGIVNSVEGYQNLVRFLFGQITIDGRFIVDDVPRNPDGVVSFYTEVTTAVLGLPDANLTERRKDHFSAVFRTQGQTLPVAGGIFKYPNPSSPHLFSVSFPASGPHSEPTALTVEIGVSPSVPAQNGRERRQSFRPNEYLFRRALTLALDRREGRLTFSFDDESAYGTGQTYDAGNFNGSQIAPTTLSIPLEAKNGFRAHLELRVTVEYDDDSSDRQAREGVGGLDAGGGQGQKLDDELVETSAVSTAATTAR